MTTLSILCDENVDKQVISYLQKNGHGGEHVVDVLEPGVDDNSDIAPYALENDFLILTKDDDFLAMDADRHAGILFIDDHRLSAYEIASILVTIASYYTREDLRGITYVTEGWL